MNWLESKNIAINKKCYLDYLKLKLMMNEIFFIVAYYYNYKRWKTAVNTKHEDMFYYVLVTLNDVYQIPHSKDSLLIIKKLAYNNYW